MQLSNKLSKNQEILLKRKIREQKELEIMDEDEPARNFIVATWIQYSSNCGIHGVQYLTNQTVQFIGKIFWLLTIILALFGLTFCCLMLAERFRSSLTATVIETTTYPVSEIPFPSIALCSCCPNDYDRLDEAADKFLGKNYTEKQRKVFDDYAKIIGKMWFGSFELFEDWLAPGYDKSVDHINATEIVKYMIFDCPDMLIECRWRGKLYNCCDIFSLQSTEYGNCYTFNSLASEGTSFINRSNNFPWRVYDDGIGSALTVVLDLQLKKNIYKTKKPGVYVLMQPPYQHPSMGTFVSSNAVMAMMIKPVAYTASPDVARLDPEKRGCYFGEEVAHLKSLSLNNLPYTRLNCMSACRIAHIKKFCNCTYGFLFSPHTNIPECVPSHSACLEKHNDILLMEKPKAGNPFFDDEPGIECPCLPDCFRVELYKKMKPIYGEKLAKPGLIKIDFHWESSTMIKYRMDVVNTWMDLVIGFGGILGLFFGCSLLSGIEIIFYLTLGLYQQYKENKKKIVKRFRARHPFIH